MEGGNGLQPDVRPAACPARNAAGVPLAAGPFVTCARPVVLLYLADCPDGGRLPPPLPIHFGGFSP